MRAETRKCHLARRTVWAHCREGAGRFCPESNSLLQRSKGGVRIYLRELRQPSNTALRLRFKKKMNDVFDIT